MTALAIREELKIRCQGPHCGPSPRVIAVLKGKAAIQGRLSLALNCKRCGYLNIVDIPDLL